MTTPADNKPPVTQLKDALDALQITVDSLASRVKTYDDLGLLLADCRDTMTEAIGEMREQHQALLQRLDQRPPQRQRQAPRWMAWACGGLAGAVLVSLLWHWVPTRPSRYAALLSSLDSLIVQHYSTFPKPLQEQLSAVYAHQGVLGPAQRQGGRR